MTRDDQRCRIYTVISNKHLKDLFLLYNGCNVHCTVLRLFSRSLGAMDESVLEFEPNMIKREFMHIGLKFELNAWKADG